MTADESNLSSNEQLYVCECAEVYGSHHPECPAQRQLDRQRAEIERLTRELKIKTEAYEFHRNRAQQEATERDRLREGLEQIARGDYTGASFVAREVLFGAPRSSDETKEDPVLEISDFPEHIELHPDFGDPEVMLNAREWLQKACEAKGARFTGGGIGMGESDIDIELEGCHFNIRMKPIMRSAHTVKGDETKGRLFYHPECASCKAGHLPCIHGYHASCPHGCVTWREDEERNRASENGLGDP